MDSITIEKLEFDRVREILARYCRCGLGSSLARKIAPSRDGDRVRTWLAQTTEMVDTLREVGLPPFGGIIDIGEALDRATPGGGASGVDYAAISGTLRGCAGVKQWSGQLTDATPLLIGLLERLSEFDAEIEAIDRVVDERGEVRDTASDRLAAIRREATSCREQIRQIVYAFTRRADVAQYLQSTNVQMHEDRFVLPVKAEHRGRLPGVVHRSSHTGATLFIEPAECVQLNNRLVQLRDKEHDEIIRLLGELSIRVHKRHEEIRRSLRVLAQIDLLAAKAQYAYQFEMTCPEISTDGHFQLHQCRHPLLIEQVYQQEREGVPAEQRHPVMPIDVRLGSDFDLLIITGSNTGGKTVALKTVGLISLMAQSGMHIPTQRGATLRLLNDILLDVGDEQSLEQSLSTFGGHLKRIRHILKHAGPQSLVLLDELGSGTDPDEGGAIGQAILDELLSVECLGIVTTHLGVLKAYAYNHDRADNASVEFDTATLSPTYRLLIGTPGESHAIIVAEHYGLPQRVLKRARHHLPRSGWQLRQAIRATTATRQASEEARVEAHTAKIEAQQRQELYQTKLTGLEQMAEQFADWLGSLPAMKPGDEIFVRRLNRTGRLVRLQLSKQMAVVDMDGMEAEVPLQELMPELGATGASDQVVSLRRQIEQKYRQAEAELAEVEQVKADIQKKAAALEKRQDYVNAWLEAIGQLHVGSKVTFDRKPGHGKVTSMDLPAGKVTVEAGDLSFELRMQELFPEHGAFGRRKGGGKKSHGRDESPKGRGRPKGDRRIPHRKAGSSRARASRDAVLKLEPGSDVYVVPFAKRARLIRIDEAKDLAIVQSGAFEMQVALADVEPVGHRSAPASKQPKKDRATKQNPPRETDSST